MKLVHGLHPEVCRWVCEQIPWTAPDQMTGDITMGVMDAKGDLVGGVIFHDWNPHYRSIEISAASTTPKWLTRAMLHVIFAYPFEQLGCRRITASTPPRAASARQFLETFGFRREGLIRRGFGTDNALVYGLLDDEWRQGRFCLHGRVLTRGQEEQSRPAASA